MTCLSFYTGSVHHLYIKVGTHQATSCSNISRRHVTATNRFVCTVQFFCKNRKIVVSAKGFCHCNKSHIFDFLQLVAATKCCCGDKDLHKNSPKHTKQFVTATSRHNLLLQLVAQPVHKEWPVAATCCCNLSPSVLRSIKVFPFKTIWCHYKEFSPGPWSKYIRLRNVSRQKLDSHGNIAFFIEDKTTMWGLLFFRKLNLDGHVTGQDNTIVFSKKLE